MVRENLIKATVIGQEELSRKLKRASFLVNDLRIAYNIIGRDALKENRKNFILKGIGKYEPLSSKYEARKTKLAGRKLPILVGAKKTGGESGKMRDSVTKRNSTGAIYSVGKRGLLLGTSIDYAKYVQKGTSKMPSRPFLFLTKKQIAKYKIIIDAEVKRQMTKTGLNVTKSFGGLLRSAL